MGVAGAAMSDVDRAIVVSRIKEVWPGIRDIPARGTVLVSPVRDGGLTDALIKVAAEIADQYYHEKSLY